jgi:signal transduction histidine kinase
MTSVAPAAPAAAGAPLPGTRGSSGRPSAQFWVGVVVLAAVVVGGTLGAAHRGASPWAGGPDVGPVIDAPRPLDGWGLLLALVPVLSLVAVRRPGRPGVAGCATAIAALLAYLLVGYPFGPVFLPVVVAVLMAAWSGRRWLAWTTATAMAASGGLALVLRDAFGQSILLALVPWLAILVLVGEGLRVRRERRAVAYTAQVAELESRIATERLGIARELHDVLAHSLSAINVQAGVGLHLLDSDPAQARASLQAVKETSKQALDDMRGVIGALRRDGEVLRAPTPGMADLAGLLDQVTSSGIRVDSDVMAAGPVPWPVGAAAYRIVQEALTNVRRHASSPEAVVILGREHDQLVVTVRSPLAVAARDRPADAGHGLVGMRERTEALGGRFRAGPEGAEFVVRATFPLGGAG